jgi:hypothetical protein
MSSQGDIPAKSFQGRKSEFPGTARIFLGFFGDGCGYQAALQGAAPRGVPVRISPEDVAWAAFWKSEVIREDRPREEWQLEQWGVGSGEWAVGRGEWAVGTSRVLSGRVKSGAPGLLAKMPSASGEALRSGISGGGVVDEAFGIWDLAFGIFSVARCRPWSVRACRKPR